jgi:hypothetical protein
MQQPGSRLYYISVARGSDSTGDIYFWDGSRIIDSAGKPANASNVAYGTDPMNPSSAVKPFKRWAYVGPRDGANADIGTPGLVGSPTPVARGGFPDWWMFSRGETFDLTDDLMSFEHETKPATASLYSSLAVPGGRSATERQIVGAYGSACLPRPRFVHPLLGFVTRYTNSYSPVFKNVAYLSLHFDSHDRSSTAPEPLGLTLLAQTAASTDLLFEDVWFDAATINIGSVNSGEITLRRSLLTDNFGTSGSSVQGIFYDGSATGRFRIEDSILMRNGFSHGDPKKLPWPPSGDQTWDLYSRNLYISGQTDFTRSGMFDSVSMMGASGDQFRPGGQIERNFFYQGYVGVGAHGGYADAAGATGVIRDNVLQKFTGVGTKDNRGHPGWGFQLGGGAYGVEVSRNIVTGAQSPGTYPAFQFQPVYQDCYLKFTAATRSNLVKNNIFEAGPVSGAIKTVDGADPCYGVVLPGVRGNKVTDNALISAKGIESEYAPIGSAVGTPSDTVFKNNRIFTSRAAAAAAMGWSAPDRTLKSFMTANGVAVTSSDGFPEYFEQATQQRRGQWRSKWTSRELVNYFRGGFGMAPLN